MAQYRYLITNLTNNKQYCGICNDTKDRWGKHRREAFINMNDRPLYRAMRRDGIDNFKFEIVQEISSSNLEEDRKLICEAEKAWTEQNGLYPSTYNLKHGGENNNIYSEESKEKMRRVATGRKQTKEHIENSRKANVGHKVSKETRERIGAKNRNRVLDEKTKQHLRDVVNANKKYFIIWKISEPKKTYQFNSFKQADEFSDSSAIGKALNGKIRHSKGWCAKYLDDERTIEEITEIAKSAKQTKACLV